MSFLINPYVSFPQGAAVGPASVAFLQTASDTVGRTTYTFASQNLGTVATDRRIIVGFAARGLSTSAFTIESASIAGISATIAVQQSHIVTNANVAGLLIATVPSGASGDVVVTLSREALRAGIGSWRADGMGSNTATETRQSTAADPTASLPVLAGGFAVALGAWGVGTTGIWTGLAEKFDVQLASNFTFTGASDDFAAAATPTVTVSPDGASVEEVGVFGAWQ